MKANTKKNSTTKKLVPAAGSLLISAAMLGTSTYAWFTMSREVEVKNIQMTATVPEDIQISIGKIGTGNDIESKNTGTSLGNSAGVLVKNGGVVAEPRTTGQYQAIDWSNSVDISHYYSFGKLIPASSDTGVNIFFTPDANGIGQTVKTDAKYYQAANGINPIAETAAYASGAGGNNLNATAYIKTSDNDGWTSYSGATAWNDTKDDGYYVDIPVWLRTSSSSGANLKVKAYVIDRNEITNFGSNTSATADNKELYRAVRVAILTNAGAAAASGTGNLVQVKDGGQTGENLYNSGSVLDWYGASSGTAQNPFTVHGGAVTSINTQGTTSPTYTSIADLAGKLYNGTNSVASLAAGTGTAYGAPTQVIIRVWLEGEDPDCFNETAGQDWSINLMFEKI